MNNDFSLGVSVVSAKDRPRQIKNTLESFLAYTPENSYRLIWHHIIGHDETTNYLIEQNRIGKITHLFLHHFSEDWRWEGLHNTSALLLTQEIYCHDIKPIQWFMVCCDDMQFEPGWYEQTVETIKMYSDLNIGIWSPYRPPEHVGNYPPMERDGKKLWIYNSLAPRCCLMRVQHFFDCGMFHVHKQHTADWKLIMEMEKRQLGFAVIDGEKVKHVDWGYSPAHSPLKPDKEFQTDEEILKEHGGYRGDPHAIWPEEKRPDI